MRDDDQSRPCHHPRPVLRVPNDDATPEPLGHLPVRGEELLAGGDDEGRADAADLIPAGRYATANDLPKADAGPEKFGTDLWFKLENTPPAWADKFLQVRIFAWDDKAKGWEAEPAAVSDRVVWGKGKLWQHNLTLLAAKGSERSKGWKKDFPALPEGRYLVRVYVDADGKLAKDWTAKLGEAEYVGEAAFKAKWRAGNGVMTAVDAGGMKK